MMYLKNAFIVSLLLLLIPPQLSHAQILWELPLYFTDASGNKDTVVIGHAPDATNGTDAHLGEVELNDELWSGDFEVRILRGSSAGGSGDLWENPQYKKMYLKGEGDYGSPDLAISHYRIVVHSDSLPVTMNYDSNLIGHPSFVNLMQARSQDIYLIGPEWWYQPYPVGHPAHPTFRCMMRNDVIVEDFSYHLWTDSIQGHGQGVFGTTIFMANGDTVFTPGFELTSFTSWAGNYYCDRITGVDDIDRVDADLIVQNPVGHYLDIKSVNQDFQSWWIYDMRGQAVLEGELFYEDRIDLSGTNPGVYLFTVMDDVGRLYSQRFVKY